MVAVILSLWSNVGNILLDRYILTKHKIRLEHYIPLLFAFLFILTAITLPYLGAINTILVVNQQYIFYFILMVLLAIIWNIFYYQGLQKESMVEFQMILMLTPLMTVMLASLFFPEEFNPATFAAAIIGSLTLFLAHLRKHHFYFDSYAIHLVLAGFLISMETMVQKELLAIYSPALLYASRTAILALFFAIYYRPMLKNYHFSGGEFRLVFYTALLGAISMVAKFYGFQSLGITYTTLILLLGPVLVTWFDSRMNGTKVSRRNLLALIIILGCVIYATINL